MEKQGAPRDKATMLVAAGHATTHEEATKLVERGLFEELMGLDPGEKLASADTQRGIRNQLRNVPEEE